MKKTGEIVGLPIVSLVDGGEIGIVKSLVIDAKNAAIAAIVVDDNKWYKDATLVAFPDILGIGESALTIENKDTIKPLVQVPEFEKLLEADVNILNTKVLSKKGQIKGTVVDVYFDPESGKIIECHAKNESGTDFTIPVERIYTLGAGITVVSDENETMVKPVAVTASTPAPVVANVEVTTPTPVVEAPPVAPAENAAEGDVGASDAMQKFEERQKKFLLGKKASRRISADNGTIIIEQGEEVTEEVLQKAKLAGKFVELSMSLQ